MSKKIERALRQAGLLGSLREPRAETSVNKKLWVTVLPN